MGAFNFDAQLFDAAKSGNVNGVHEAARQGANVNVQDEYGRKPLHYAVREDRLGAMVALFEQSANVDAMDRLISTPLRYAVVYKTQWAIRLFVAKGADVSIWDDRVGTLLHVAAGGNLCADPEGNVNNNLIDVVRILIELGVNVNALNCNDQTVLDIAQQWETQTTQTIAELLRACGARTGAEIRHSKDRISLNVGCRLIRLVCNSYSEYGDFFCSGFCAVNLEVRPKVPELKNR